MTTPTHPVIVVDWGTTAFRAWLVEAGDGRVHATIPDGRGMRELAGTSFRDYCAERLTPWRSGPGEPPPVYLAGMVGAATGWATAPQPALPLRPQDLAAHIIPAPGLDNAWLLPGVRVDSDAPDRVDVMRGEEVQILGALGRSDRRNAILCLPGTHSKWARVVDGVLKDFTTFMTGEVYAALLGHTLLGQGVEAGAIGSTAGSVEAFRRGLTQATVDGAGLLAHAFAARTRRLYRDLAADDVPAFLSGLLIGEELAGAAALGYLPRPEVVVVGAEALAARYAEALAIIGTRAETVAAADATLAGVLALARLHRPSPP
ncbi:2-dehydro-3-deoxygalactonokinase [Caenispirillum bisanense]|uniref:2-dehydro-3-deoxygalactonokinase n=1 Tax=Caenispirillum bisanense TaxID=414052 RepID=UPI0031E1F3EB